MKAVLLPLLVYAAGIGPQLLAVYAARRLEVAPLRRAVQSNCTGGVGLHELLKMTAGDTSYFAPAALAAGDLYS